MAMNQKQLIWLSNMRSALQNLHIYWYGWDDDGRRLGGGMNSEHFADIDRQIRKACERLGIEVQDSNELAERNEFWDGEMHGPLVVLGLALDAIVLHFKNVLNNGVQAYKEGISFFSNPYLDGHNQKLIQEWANGWGRAQIEASTRKFTENCCPKKG